MVTTQKVNRELLKQEFFGNNAGLLSVEQLKSRLGAFFQSRSRHWRTGKPRLEGLDPLDVTVVIEQIQEYLFPEPEHTCNSRTLLDKQIDLATQAILTVHNNLTNIIQVATREMQQNQARLGPIPEDHAYQQQFITTMERRKALLNQLFV